MEPFVRNLNVIRGATFRWVGKFAAGPKGGPITPVDLTGCFAEMEIRGEAGELLYTMPAVDLEITAQEGKVSLYIEDEITDGFAWEVGSYDLFMNFSNGERYKFLRGKVKVQPRVTQR